MSVHKRMVNTVDADVKWSYRVGGVAALAISMWYRLYRLGEL